MNKKTAVIVAPYYKWVDKFWRPGLIKDSGTNESSIRLLDWVISGLDDSHISDILVICHPDQKQLLNHLDNISIILCEDTQPLIITLGCFRDIKNEIILIYPWVIFHKEFFHEFIHNDSSDIVVACDSNWLDDGSMSYKDQVSTEKFTLNNKNVVKSGRFLDKNKWHCSFAGVLLLKQQAVVKIVSIIDSLSAKKDFYFHDAVDIGSIKISDFIQELLDEKYNISYLEISKNASIISKQELLQEFVFGTKGQTLERLKPNLKKSNISDLIIFSVFDWKNDKFQLLSRIRNYFKGHNVVVRSSSIAEDGWDESLAGAFYSVLNVDISNQNSLEIAIQDVIDSYKKVDNSDGLSFNQNQILIQTFIRDVDISGVIFTRDLHTGAPYYVINYDAYSGRTDSVTSGDTNNLKTLVVYRNSNDKKLDSKFKKLLIACREIEYQINCDSLDIEFSISNDGLINIFQVRPMAVANSWKSLNQSYFSLMLDQVSSYVSKVNSNYGITVFSNMTDWNPAEMISTSPHPLARSLYEYLITDSIWRLSREECEYSNPDSESLMVTLGGRPYINVRSSFKSFLPKSISKELGKEFVDSWIKQLINNPEQHDKVEFNIVPTCYTFNLDFLLENLIASGVSKDSVNILKRALLDITDRHISQKILNINSELNKVKRLEERVSDYEKREVTVSNIKRLLDDCRENGTLPFSNLARMAFIATAILKSLVDISILSKDDEINIKGNIHTITSEIIEDFELLNRKNIDMNIFLKKYGHLRPGSYDINSKRYDEDPNLYLSQSSGFSIEKRKTKSLDSFKLTEIDKLLKLHGFNSNARDLMSFIHDAVKGREDAKFGFTKALSLAIKMIEKLGLNNGIARSDMAYVDIHSLMRWDSNISVTGFKDSIYSSIERNKAEYVYEKVLTLPDIITEFTDINIYHKLHSKPNFVTKSKVIAEKVCLDFDDQQQINNKIVMIKSSDPGFDWIFTHKIQGLVTMFGGANSHMAIRCAEFNIPAAIGCGEVIYNSLLNDKMIEIDSVGEIIRPCIAH